MRPTNALTLALLSTLLVVAAPLLAADQKHVAPSTAAAAAKVLDLSKLPRIAESEEPGQQTLANLFYQAPGTVAKAFDFHKAQLVERGFKELPGSYASEQSSNATFQKNGYLVSLSAFSAGEPGKVTVSLNQHGNVDLSKLPMPAGAKTLYAGPASAMSVAKAAPDKIREECRSLLMKQGWELYGEAGDAIVLRQNAVKLTANVSAAPAQNNQTMISYSAVLMSVELPASPKAVGVNYSDSPAQLAFDFPGPMDELTAFYAKALSPAGWKQTTDKPFKFEIYDELIYRNPSKDLLTLRMHDFEGQTRGLLRFQTSAEVEEQDRLAKAELERRAKENNTPKNAKKVSINVPNAAKDVKSNKDEITFTVAAGKAKAAVEQLVKELTSQGWKGEVSGLDDLAGAVSLSNDAAQLTIHYTDTGVIPSEVTIDAVGVELEPAKTK